MRLADLEPEFHRYETRMMPPAGHLGPGLEWSESDYRPAELVVDVATLAEAQGVCFLCPACFVKNGGAVGTHGITVTFRDRGALDHQGSHAKGTEVEGKYIPGPPSRWEVSGTDFNDLTLSPSADCGCWHGFITNGEVTP